MEQRFDYFDIIKEGDWRLVGILPIPEEKVLQPKIINNISEVDITNSNGELALIEKPRRSNDYCPLLVEFFTTLD